MLFSQLNHGLIQGGSIGYAAIVKATAIDHQRPGLANSTDNRHSPGISSTCEVGMQFIHELLHRPEGVWKIALWRLPKRRYVVINQHTYPGDASLAIQWDAVHLLLAAPLSPSYSLAEAFAFSESAAQAFDIFR